VLKAILVQVVAFGCVKDYEDFRDVLCESYALAVAAGNIIIYHELRRANLINFPNISELEDMFV